MRYVLDTDTVTHQQIGHPSVLAQLRLVDRSTVATTVITMYEQMRGRLAAVNRPQSDAQLQLAFRRLQQRSSITVLPASSPLTKAPTRSIKLCAHRKSELEHRIYRLPPWFVRTMQSW